MNDKPMEETVQSALKSVAKQEGISVESVRQEIDLAIAAARQDGDPSIQAFWDSIPTENNNPLTTEDIIAYFARLNMDERG